MSKIDKSKLTTGQKKILFEEETEAPGSSPLNYEKRDGDSTARDVEQNFLNLKQNMKAEVVGHLSLKHYQMFLIQKLIL